MAVKHTSKGLRTALDFLTFDYQNDASWFIGLFDANITPAYNTPEADYLANEADFDGYTRLGLSAWAPAVDDADHARATAPTYTWIVTGTSTVNQIYGYFISNGTDVFFAERDPAAPQAIGGTVGQTYKVTPNLALTNE